MNHELVLEGNAFVNESFQQCCIGIDDGKITAIKKILTGDTHYRFSKQLLLPAGIDVHVHFREPGMMHKETFGTGSVAAAFGGISCVFDMPNTQPSTITPELLIEKKKIAERKSIVDFGLYAGISKKILSNDDFVNKIGTLSHGFKLFLGETTHSSALPKESIRSVFTKIKPLHKPILVHAEDGLCLQKYTRSEQCLSDHHAARPPQCEQRAITQLISIAKKIETPVHICHVSSTKALNALFNKPDFITYGITPHHSLLNIQNDQVPSTWLKVNPPLRSKTDQQQLFKKIQNGDVFLLESDHAPHTLKEKDTVFSEAPNGIPGVETLFPLFLALAEKQQLTFQRVISLLCKRPSQLMSLSKGSIVIDHDADIITVDRRNITKIKSDLLHSKSEWTPFEGFPAIFPSNVFIRGVKVIEDYEQQVSPGNGTMIPLNG